MRERNPRRPGKRPGAERFAGDPEIAGGFRRHVIDFVEWMRAMHYSEHTIKNHRIDLGYFIAWCEERSILRPEDVTRAILERYRQHVYHYRRKTDGEALSFACQGKRLISIRVFFRWMTRQHHLLFNPASELELPKMEKRLPRHVLTVAEVESILNGVKVNDATGLGIRDRAMLETLYSTGVRRQELVNLKLNDLDRERGTLMIRQGKGRKDRMVPIGARAVAWIEKYLADVRSRYVEEPDDGFLFLAKHGEALTGKQLSYIVKRAIDRGGLERAANEHLNSACHLFRHACATHMLENGADIRFIQALLGHADLSTTDMYTQVSIMKLKAVHEATHPARLGRAGRAADGDELDTATRAENAKAALLAALASEREEEEGEAP